jgi:hypothetical protein
MREAEIQAEILIAATQDGHRVFRRNAGKCWLGVVVSRIGDILTLKHPRMVELGIEGTPDLQGHSRTGRAIYIEVKAPKGPRRQQQEQFIAMAQDMGCLAGFATSVEEARAIWTDHNER